MLSVRSMSFTLGDAGGLIGLICWPCSPISASLGWVSATLLAPAAPGFLLIGSGRALGLRARLGVD